MHERKRLTTTKAAIPLVIFPTRLCSQFALVFHGTPDQTFGRTLHLQIEILHERKFPKRKEVGRPPALQVGGPSPKFNPSRSQILKLCEFSLQGLNLRIGQPHVPFSQPGIVALNLIGLVILSILADDKRLADPIRKESLSAASVQNQDCISHSRATRRL